MLLRRTQEDVLRAYKVYKCMDVIKKKTNEQDSVMFTLIAMFVALYDGMSFKELEAVLPVSRSCLKDIVRKGIYNYRLFNYDHSLVLGRQCITQHVYKGVLTLTDSLKDCISYYTKGLSAPFVQLKAFAALLSNSSSHVIIIKDNVENIGGGKEILRHLNALFTSVVNHNLYSESNYAKNLSNLGYMRRLNGDIELNKNAIMLSKEPKFELRTV